MLALVATNCAGEATSKPKIVTSGSSSVVDVILTVRTAETIVAPAGIVIPVNRQAFQTPVVSQFANGFAVILTTVLANSLASSAEAATAIGPIVVGIRAYSQYELERIQQKQTAQYN